MNQTTIKWTFTRLQFKRKEKVDSSAWAPVGLNTERSKPPTSFKKTIAQDYTISALANEVQTPCQHWTKCSRCGGVLYRALLLGNEDGPKPSGNRKTAKFPGQRKDTLATSVSLEGLDVTGSRE